MPPAGAGLRKRVMVDHSKPVPKQPEGQAAIDAFLRQVAAAPAPAAAGRGRLVFALDATASRQPTWDVARGIQGEMFRVAEQLGGLAVQLVFYRGLRECLATPFLASAAELQRRMAKVECLGGQTQLARILSHTLKQTARQKVAALVFVGDAFEEDLDHACALAGELGIAGVPAFLFHEGGDPVARRAFEQIARLSGGACCPFDPGSAQQLRELLGAVAAYAAGGRPALARYGEGRSAPVLQLIRQLGPPRPVADGPA